MARNVFSLTSTGPGMCNLTCPIGREIFHNARGKARAGLPIANHLSRLVSKLLVRRGRVSGGSYNGTVFSLSLPPLPPQLTLDRSGADVILTWPTDGAGFNLQ